MLYQLNLPPLPTSVIKEVLEYSNLMFEKLDAASGVYYSNNRGYRGLYKTENIVSRYLTSVNFKNKELQDWFSEYFPIVAYEELFLMKNKGNSLSIFPPHTDADRNLAINYVFAEGGKNVVTSTFKGPKFKDISIARYYHEDHLEIDSADVLPLDTWYVFDAQQPHSVKNIESIRIVLVSRAHDNMSLDDFVKRYPHLIK